MLKGMPTLSRLCLGTVQFGLDYGVSNRSGKPEESEVASILSYAAESGVGYLDTASDYGNAEDLIGRYLPRGFSPRIVTKLPSIGNEVISPTQKQFVSDSISRSLERMRVDRLHAALLHNVMDLAKPGAEYLVEALLDAQGRGEVSLIGASVYDADQISLVQQHFRPQLIQLPFSALDRRLSKSGALKNLKSAGAEIHARSIFLQGLLLMDPQKLPDFFAPLRQHIDSVRLNWEKRGLTALSGALASVLAQKEIDVVVVGVNRKSEFVEIVDSIRGAFEGSTEFDSDFAINPIYLNPARWPSFTKS